MNDPILNAILTGLIGLASGAALAYLGAILKFRKDLEAEYDKDLRRSRIDAYKELWKHLELVARYDRPKPLNRKTLKELTVSMREWYFQVGGLYLSEETRKAYFDLKQMIKDFLDAPQSEAEEDLDPRLKLILNQASILRSCLTQDIGTRRSSALADS